MPCLQHAFIFGTGGGERAAGVSLPFDHGGGSFHELVAESLVHDCLEVLNELHSFVDHFVDALEVDGRHSDGVFVMVVVSIVLFFGLRARDMRERGVKSEELCEFSSLGHIVLEQSACKSAVTQYARLMRLPVW